VKVGDLVKVKVMKASDYGVILEINSNNWIRVYWITIADSWSFYSEDLEVINEMD
jgi:predicted RNA-binding protein with RPS1 domain